MPELDDLRSPSVVQLTSSDLSASDLIPVYHVGTNTVRRIPAQDLGGLATNATVVAAIAEDPAAIRAAAQIDARGGRNVSAVLPTDETGNANTATLKTSSTLSLALEAGTWDVEALIVVNCNSLTAGSRQKLHFTGTYSSFGGIVYGVDNGTLTSTGYPSSRATGVAVDYERVASGSSIVTLRTGRIVVTAAGNIVAQFAQQTATAATSPTLVAGSYIRAIKVA